MGTMLGLYGDYRRLLGLMRNTSTAPVGWDKRLAMDAGLLDPHVLSLVTGLFEFFSRLVGLFRQDASLLPAAGSRLRQSSDLWM